MRDWIPIRPGCEMPKDDDIVQGTILSKGERFVCDVEYFHGGCNEWWYPGGETIDGEVIAWMPIPAPWQGELPEELK